MEWSIIWEYREALYVGFLRTVLLAGVSIPCAYLLGVILGCIGSLRGFLPRALLSLYVEPMRNLPVVVKLFFLYFVLGLDAVETGIITLVMHHSAYIADITAAGFRSIPREQYEAAHACGHGRTQIFLYILVPQMVRIVIPPLTSQFIDVLKNSSLCMLIGVQEMTFQTQEIGHITFRGFEAATAVTALYVALALAIAGTMGVIQRALVSRR